jgi:hypothetical protein
MANDTLAAHLGAGGALLTTRALDPRARSVAPAIRGVVADLALYASRSAPDLMRWAWAVTAPNTDAELRLRAATLVSDVARVAAAAAPLARPDRTALRLTDVTPPRILDGEHEGVEAALDRIEIMLRRLHRARSRREIISPADALVYSNVVLMSCVKVHISLAESATERDVALVGEVAAAGRALQAVVARLHPAARGRQPNRDLVRTALECRRLLDATDTLSAGEARKLATGLSGAARIAAGVATWSMPARKLSAPVAARQRATRVEQSAD